MFDRSLEYLHEGIELSRHTHAGLQFGMAAYMLGNADTAAGAYEDALQWYQELSDYASKAPDSLHHVRVPNLIGGVHLDVFDLDTALRLNLEGDLALAIQTDSRKHVARAQRLQGAVLAASGRLAEAAQTLAASVHLAEHIQTPREVWLGKAALGKVLAQLCRDREAEVQLTQATQTIEAIAANLHTPRLHRSFLSAPAVLDIYAALGHRPPDAERH